MNPAIFLEKRQPSWKRLEALVEKAQRSGLAGLDEKELHELTRLYPAAAIDVSQARMYRVENLTQRRINNLAISAHGLIYRREKKQPFKAIWTFFRVTYPQLFRRLSPYMGLAVAIFMMGILASYVSTRLVPANAYLFVPGELDITDGTMVSSEDISERFRQMPSPPMATGIITNNISVAFNAFALGITAGVGTCYVIIFNALMLGGFMGHFANHGLSYELWSFLAPHGVLEIFAILIAAAAGLRLGISLFIPGSMTRKTSLRIGAREAVYLVLGTVPMFAVAGIIEGFITPSYIAGWFKILLGLLVWGVVVVYLLLTARHSEENYAV